jgi:hypothetical protein
MKAVMNKSCDVSQVELSVYWRLVERLVERKP